MKAEIHDEVERLNYQTVVNENPDCHFSERKKRFFLPDERTILERVSFLIHTLHDFYLYRIRLPITRRKKFVSVVSLFAFAHAIALPDMLVHGCVGVA